MAADDNVPFSSLDSLGPEYGSINTPTIDAKGLAAFEGDRIDMPKINFPETQSFTPVLPDVENLTNPASEVRKTVVGNPPSKPGINKNASFDQLRKSMKDYALGTLRSNADKNQYGKIYSYNAGPDGNAFYKRYQAYGQDKFDEIGFSPIRDNEALFNARTTQWDDFSRMMTNSFVPLFTRGFISGPKSLGKMLTGDFTGTDLEDAAAYEEAAAIGQSSKGGFGAFTSNAMMNFSYSAGIITEAVLEEVALGLATVGTAGIAAPALFARTAANIARVGKAVYKGINFATDGMKAINKTLDTVNSVKGAREFWNASKGFAKTVNPLSNTFDAYKLANQADNFTNLGRAYKTAGGFYRDVRNINMALSESRLEAGMVENSIYDNLYNEYYAKNNESPSDEVQYDMMKQAKKGSLNTLYWNTGLIYGSNLITFPNIVGPKGGLRNFSKATVKELSEVSGGKFGKLGKVVYDQTKKKFAFEKNNFKNYVKGWAKNPIYKSVGNTVGYFKSNFTEGIQENLQEVIGGANERYYTDTFKSGAVQSHNYSKSVSKYDYFSDELGRQVSAQGFETFASGFVMGTFASPLNKSFEYLGVGFNRMFNKEDYQKLKDKKLEITKDLVNNLNGIDVKDFLDAKIFNYGQQDIISKIKESGSKKEAMDADHEALLNQMDLLVRNGSLESYQEKLRDLQQLTPEEFEDAVPNVPKGEGAKYQMKINDTIDKMDKINSRYKTYKEKYGNPIDPDNLPPKGTPEYENAVTLHNAWEDATKNAVFFNETFEDTMKRKRDIIQKFNTQKPLQSLTQRDSEVIFDNDKLRNEVGLLKNEIESLKQLKDPASKEELKKKESKLAAMQKLGEATVSFTNFFNRYERSAEIREVLQKEKGDEPVTDEEVEAVMDEYFGEFSDDNKIQQTSEYETAFKEYLKTVANVNKDYLFDEKVDEAFELLADHHKLDSEARSLIKGVNLLHDPAGFLDLVERNQKWMKDLYARRGEYYQKMITDQFDIVVDNALLNALANKSVYISMDDFAAWKNEGIPPSEFYDHARKLVIPEGTEAYDVYYMLFDQAAQLKAEKSGTVPSSLDKILNADLEKLESQKEAELKNVPQIETKVSKGKLEPNSSGQVTAKMVQEQLQPNTYAEASYGAEDNFILFMDEEGNLRENDAEGDLVQVDTVPVTFTSVETYIIAERPNPEYTQEIEKRYEELKEDRINQYTEQVEEVEKKEKEKKTSELEPITSATSLEDIITRSPVLYNKLNKEFNERVIKKMDSEEYVNMNPEQERNLFEKFLQSDPIAKGLIDTYNKEQKLDEATKETGEKEEFEFMYQGKMVKTADLKTIQDLEKMKRRFDKMIKDISESENPTTEDMTNKSKYSIISKDLEKLINTRTKNDAKVSDEITADEYDNFVDNGIVKAGRITKIAEKVKNGTDLTQQEKEMFQDKTSEINEELRKMSEKEAAKAKPSDVEVQKAKIEKRRQEELEAYKLKKDGTPKNEAELTKVYAIEDVKNINKKYDEELDALNKPATTTVSDIESKKADIKRRRQEELNELGQKQLTKGFNSLSEATKPEQVANAIVNIEQNKNQGTLLSKEQEQQLSEAKAKLKEQGYEIVDYNIVKYGENTIIEGIDFYNSEKDILTEEQANAIELKINNLEKRGEEVTVDDLPSPVSRTIKPLIKKDGVMVQAAEVNTLIFESVEQAREAIKKSREAGNKKPNAADKINAKYDAELAALESSSTTASNIVTVYHHTNVKAQDFNFGNFQRGTDQISQFGDGLNAASTTTPFFVNRYGNPIKGEVKDSDFIVIDANMSQKAMYDMLVAKGFKFNNPQMGKSTPQGGSYVGGSSKTEYDDTNTLKDSPGSAIDLFNDFQESNPEVKGVKVINHIIGNEKIDPFYVIYDAKSFYGPGSLSKTQISTADTIPEDPQSSDDVDSPTQDSDSRKVEVIDDSKRYSINDFKVDIAKVKTMDELQQIVSDLHIKVSEEVVAFEDLQVMSELAKQKAAEIKAGTVKIDPIGLTEGTQVIAKEIIFDDAKMFAMTNDTLVVKSVDKTKKTVTVTPMGSTEEMTVGFDKLNEMFILKDTVMDTTEQVTEPVTKEEQEMVTQSSDLADTILNSPDQLTELEKTVSNKTIKELDAELLEDLKC